MAFLIIFTSILIVGISYYLVAWTYWKRRGISGPMGWPILGRVWEMTNHEYPPFLKIQEWTKKYGELYGFTEGLSKTLVISNTDLIHEIFTKQFDNFYGRNLNGIMGDPNKDPRVHLFASEGHRWKRLRNLSSPTFFNNNLKKIKDTVEDSALELLRHIEKNTSNGESIDMLAYYQEFTIDETNIYPWQCSTIINAQRKNAQRKNAQRNAQRKADGVESGDPADFIDLFLDAQADIELSSEDNVDFKKSSGKIDKKLTVDEVVGQCFVFLVAGFDTTALSLSYTTYLLARHPEIMRKVQKEIDEMCSTPSIAFEQLSKLKYLDHVIKETLRMYPLAAAANARRCMKNTQIGDLFIEKGTNIQVETWTLHYDEKIWGEEADEFRPERWEEQEFENGFMPFGLGARQCIGMRLAYMEEKVLLAHILRNYDFVVGDKTAIPLKLVGSLTTQPEHVYLDLKSRY